MKAASLEQFLAYETGLLSGIFFKVLGNRDLNSFQSACLKSLAIISTMVTIKSLKVFSTKMMTVGWRKEICQTLHKLYLTNKSFYRLVTFEQEEIDNPDQRMTSDCSSITTIYGGIIADLILIPFTTSYYIYQSYIRHRSNP